MKLKEVEKFVDDCFHRGVDLPENLVFEIEDWNDGVPEEFINYEQIEYNYRPSDDDVITIQIKPTPKPIAVEVGVENSLNSLSRKIYLGNVKKGFYEDAANLKQFLISQGKEEMLKIFESALIGQRIALIHSEASEALESFRKSKTRPNTIDFLLESKDDKEFASAFESNIKDSAEDEIADTIIRLLDFCGFMDIDIDYHIEKKLRYNSTRPHKHGKKY